MTREWKAWIEENRRRGVPAGEIYNALVRQGFAPEVAERELNVRRVRLVRFPSDRAELYTAENFLDAGECAALVALLRRSLRPSTVSSESGVGAAAFRTSRTCDLTGGEPEVQALDEKICGAMGIGPQLAEPSQGQYYEPGQEFKPHTDYFEPYELERHSTPALGQRSWTFMIYLNDVEAGGETAFVNLGLTIPPKAGTAVLWNNLRPDGAPNYDTLHQGTPVRAGYKAIITKWFRRER